MRGLFFNAQPTTDITNHPSGFDREYDSDDFNRYMGVFFSNGVFVRDDPDACKVTASGLRLDVTPGIVLVDGGQCHFELGDGLTITQGDGLYSIMCRRNNAAEVRAFELVAVEGDGYYPAPVREGDIYDMCLAHVQVTGDAAAVTDTRVYEGVCGFAALTGQPPYYPPDEANLPYILWLYTLGYPMTEEQKEAVESNPSLMEIYNQSKLAGEKVTRFPHKFGPYDLNTVTTEGVHEFQGVCTNSPYDEWTVVDQHFWVQVLRHREMDGYLHQQLFDVRGQRTFQRSLVNGVWFKWLPTTGMDVGDISTNMAHIRYGAPYPGWLICNGAVLPYSQYPELNKAAGGRFRAGFSRALTVNASVGSASYGRCSLNLDLEIGGGSFLFILNTTAGVKLYEYIKNTGEVREINSGGQAGYNGLYPVIGSEYVLYVKRTNNSSAIKIHVISPPSYYGGPVSIGPEISANAPNSNTHENAYAAYLKSPGTIEMISIFAQVAMKYGINVVSNSVSTTNITGGPSSYVDMVWVMNAEVRYFTADDSFSLPRDFTSFSQQTQLGVFQASRQDSKGNGFLTSGVLAWLLRADGSWVHYPNFFVDGEQSHFTSSYGFYWNEQLGYGVVMMSGSVPGGKPLFYFDAGGVVHRDNISAVYLDGEMGIYFSQSPWAATIGYVGSDIRLPSLLDASGQPYAHIRCK